MSSYFITGATGTVGREVVESLLSQGHQVVAASRHPQKSIDQFGDRVKAVYFDFEDASTFNQAKGTDGVFLLGPPLYPDLFNLLRPFVAQITAQGPQRLVYLSANGMDDLPELPFHGQMEAQLRQSSLDWRIVRPGFFMQNFGNYERENIEQRGVVFVPAGDGKTAFISTKDIGASVATLLVDDQYRHQVFTLTGSEHMDYHEAASLLSRVLGQSIVYPNPDEATYRQVLAEAQVPSFIADYMIPVYSLIKDGKVAEITQAVEQLTGHQPERLETVLRRDFA